MAGGGGTKKYGRNEKKCAKYRTEHRRERNKERKARRYTRHMELAFERAARNWKQRKKAHDIRHAAYIKAEKGLWRSLLLKERDA